MLVRGKSLYEAQLRQLPRGGPARHGATGSRTCCARASRSSDQQGELVGAAVAKHTPAHHAWSAADTDAIAEYIHSIHATMGGQGSPPGRNPTGIELNVLVGDAKAGEADFAAACSSCHSVTGDLKGIGIEVSRIRARCRTRWVAGSRRRFGGGGGGRGGGGAGNPATVTMADGSKLEGTLVRKDDFLVILTLADGTRKSIARNNGVPKVDVKDPQATRTRRWCSSSTIPRTRRCTT